MMRDFDMDKFLHDNYVTISYESQPIGPDKIVLYLTTFDMERYEKEQILEKKEERVEIDTSIAPIVNPLDSTYVCDEYSGLKWNYCLLDIEEQVSRIISEYYEQKVKELQEKIDEYNNKIETMCHIQDINHIDKVGNVMNVKQVNCDVIEGNVMNCGAVFVHKIQGNIVNCNIRR